MVPQPFAYEYGVKDEYTGAAYQKTETQNDYGLVQGSYKVGVVVYTVNPSTAKVAVVVYTVNPSTAEPQRDVGKNQLLTLLINLDANIQKLVWISYMRRL